MDQSRLGVHGFFIAGISLLLALGSITMAIAETGGTKSISVPSPTPKVALIATVLAPPTTPPKKAPRPTNTKEALPTISPTPECPIPANTTVHKVRKGESAASIASNTNTSVNHLLKINCLSNPSQISPGIFIHIPIILPTNTPTRASSSTKCGQPSGWVKYKIKSKDTLYSLSKAYKITVADLQFANCMGSSTRIITGNILFVPPVLPLSPNNNTLINELTPPISPSPTPSPTPT